MACSRQGQQAITPGITWGNGDPDYVAIWRYRQNELISVI